MLFVASLVTDKDVPTITYPSIDIAVPNWIIFITKKNLFPVDADDAEQRTNQCPNKPHHRPSHKDESQEDQANDGHKRELYREGQQGAATEFTLIARRVFVEKVNPFPQPLGRLLGKIYLPALPRGDQLIPRPSIASSLP